MRQIDLYPLNILDRTKNFSVSIIKSANLFPRNAVGFTLVDQLVRAATSIGANLTEAQEAVSGKDFQYKISIALKEAKETYYWLEIITRSNIIDGKITSTLLQECSEIVKILIAISKKLKANKS